MRNKLWSIVVIMSMLVLLLSACGPAATEEPAPEAPATEAPAAAEPTEAEPAEPAAPAEKVSLVIESWRNDDLSIWQDTIIPAFNAHYPDIEVVFAPTAPGVTVPLSINDVFWRNDVTLTTSYAGSPADHVTALELIRSGALRVGEMITHRLGLAETGLGFRMVTNLQGYNSIKVIIEPQR